MPLHLTADLLNCWAVLLQPYVARTKIRDVILHILKWKRSFSLAEYENGVRSRTVVENVIRLIILHYNYMYLRVRSFRMNLINHSDLLTSWLNVIVFRVLFVYNKNIFSSLNEWNARISTFRFFSSCLIIFNFHAHHYLKPLSLVLYYFLRTNKWGHG